MATAVRIPATLLRADSGRTEIDGIDEADHLDVVVRHAADIERAAAVVGRVTGVTPEVDRDARRVGAPVRDRMAALGAIVPELVEARVLRVPVHVPVRPVRRPGHDATRGEHDRRVEPAVVRGGRGARTVRQPRWGRRVLGRAAPRC